MCTLAVVAKQDLVAVEELQSFGSGNPQEVGEGKKFATLEVVAKRDQLLAEEVAEEYQRQLLVDFPCRVDWATKWRFQWVWWEAEVAFQVAHLRLEGLLVVAFPLRGQ